MNDSQRAETPTSRESFDSSPQCATNLDNQDPLGAARSQFAIPLDENGKELIYMSGNSLGLAPKNVKTHLDNEIDRWSKLGVEAHFKDNSGTGLEWVDYHEAPSRAVASLIGAKPHEVVVMNSLTVNLHLLMVSFYRPTPKRHKILIEAGAFPSDYFAVESQISQRGYNVADSLVTVTPKSGSTFSDNEIVDAIEAHGDELALVLLPGVQYYSGQAFQIDQVTEAAHSVGSLVGIDLAHAIGNLELSLHNAGPDFAVWCSYKYLNAGPGAVGGAFIHERWRNDETVDKFTGWWGTKKSTRFEMKNQFEPIPGAESWQLSNAPVLSIAALNASLEVFDQVGGMAPLRRKSEQQLAYFDYLLNEKLAGRMASITPAGFSERGCQVSLSISSSQAIPTPDAKRFQNELAMRGVICDWRAPDVIRVAPVPLYNSFTEIFKLIELLDETLADLATGRP